MKPVVSAARVTLLLILLRPIGVAWGQAGVLDAEFAGAGARPLSMGGAFLALADDSTAAEFNPAGIRILPRPEIAWQITRTFDRREEWLPNATLRSGNTMFTQDENSWTTPSFISFVYPTQEATWAVSQLTTVDFSHRYDDPAPSFSGNTFFSKTEASNHSFGLTYAFDLQPRLHMGVTLRMNRFDFRSRTSRAVQELTDWSPNANVGLLWRVNKDWSLGAVYKSSQKVSGRIRGGSVDASVDTDIPETVGMGVAYHPNDKIRVLADIDYINWSEFDGNPQDDFRRQDVTRYHLGGEYLLSVNDDRALFLRGGYMREESNAFFYTGSNSLLLDAFPEKDDRDHLTLGIGVAKEKYQIDLAVDHVLEGGTTLILAMIHFF
jgi:long-subunit fatty acid transport protein